MSRPPVAPRRPTYAAAAAYLALSVAYFGLRVLPHFGSELVGTGSDPQLFVWAFAWWPHAIGAGVNPVLTHLLWTPEGSDLAWTTAVPGLALPLAPLTVMAGPIASYNVAAIVLPAVAAFGGFLLCRHLTHAFWPSFVGGYLFGFSSYMLGQELGHPHLTAAFAVPFSALLLLRYLAGELRGRGLVLRLGPLLAFQFALGTEVFFTLTLAVAVGLAAAALSAPGLRRELRALLAPLAGSYGVCFAIVSPLLFYALRDFHGGSITPTGGNGADLVTFGFPTGLTAVGGTLAQHFDPSIPLVSAENGEYLGLPTILIAAWYLWRGRRAAAGRFLAGCLAVACLATLGAELRVRGVSLIPLPWRLVEHLPLFDNVIPGRLALYVSLLAAVTVALWAASPAGSRGLRIILCLAAVVAVVPALQLSVWRQHPEQPRFFVTGLQRRCLRPGENTLVLPPPFRDQGLLWQAEDGFRFGVADAGLNAQLPTDIPDRATALALLDNNIPIGGAPALVAFARATGVGAILVDDSSGAQWRSLLRGVLPGGEVGGVDLYHLGPEPPGCGQA